MVAYLYTIDAYQKTPQATPLNILGMSQTPVLSKLTRYAESFLELADHLTFRYTSTCSY